MRKILSLLLVTLLTGCAVSQKASQLVDATQKPEPAKNAMQKELDAVPPPASGKISVAVYSFADKTGQRKATPGIASFSTAVTQGADSLLIRALQDVGNRQWFDVVERGNIDALTKERLIITQMRQAYEGKDAQKLMPMTFAGIIMEGGVIGYDTGLESGGIGYNFLGIGPTTQYSKDIVTVSLRAVSVNTGKVLASVTVTKMVYSTSDTVAIFKSVDPAAGNVLSQVFNNKTGTTSITAGIFQFESGVVINEGTTLALKSAIEGAVVELIKEGASRGVWDYRIDIPAAVPTRGKGAESVSLPDSAPAKPDVSADVAARTGVVK
jgi:curli production assembly/transport component CsgG